MKPMRLMRLKKSLPAVLAVALLAASFSWAQTWRTGSHGMKRGEHSVQSAEGPRRDGPMVMLKNILERAGTPLTSGQEEGLKSLAQQLRPSGPPAGLEQLREARQAYEQAVLAGQLAEAQRQADLIANLMNEAARNRMQEMAEFHVGVVNILSPDQIEAIKNQVGERGLSRLFQLGGGPRPGMAMRGHRFDPRPSPSQ